MRRQLTIWATLGLLAAVLASIVAGPAATAAPTAPAQSTTGWSGSGSSSLLDVDVNIPAVDPAHVILSPVSSSVDADAAPNSIADAANLDAGLLDDNIPLDDLLTQANQEAPPDNAEPTVDGPLIPVPVEPLLDLGVSTSSAHARWLGAGVCPAEGEYLTNSFNETAGADVLVLGEDADGTNQSVVSLVAPEGGVTGTQNTIFMTGGGTARGLTSESYTQVAEASLLEGTPLELHVSVSDIPTLTATADGTPGGASVTYNDPLVTIEAGEGGALEPLEDLGDVLNELLKETILTELVGDGLVDAVVQELLTALGDPVVVEYGVGSETLTQTTAANGTSASGDVSVLRLHISVLPVDTVSNPLLLPIAQLLAELGLSDIEANIDLGPMSAEVVVPVGGISCPPVDNPLRDVHKDVTQAEVPPGGQFDYVLTIPNRGPCTLTDVVVTDTMTAPPGTTVTSDPAADATDGNTYTWNVGELAPNETFTITMTVQVPDDAPDGFVFGDDLTAAGNCDGTPVDHTVHLDAPEVSDDFTGPCDLGQSNKSASHLEVMEGQTFNYFVHVFNQGAEPCTGVTVSDTLSDNLGFVSCTYNCTNDGQAVNWSGLTVPGGSGLTLTITVTNNAPVGTTLENTAVIDSPDDPTGPHTVTHSGPQVTDRSVPAPPKPATRGVKGPLPRTGSELPIALGAFGLMALAGLAVRRRLNGAV